MPTSYAEDHASAKADIAEAGFSVSFSRSVGTVDEATDTVSSSTTTTYTGVALRMPGDARTYAALGLTERDPITLLYATDNYGDALPPLGATTSTAALGGGTYTVQSIDPLAPDGSKAITATLVIAR